MGALFDDSELGRLDAVETAERVRRGEFSAREAVAAAIGRAQRLEPELNAIPTETYEAALRRADEPPTGPFAGVPTFVKGLDDERGVVNDYGSRAFRDHVSGRTEPFVRESFALGLVSLGHSAAPEVGLNGGTESLAHGPTRNPWSPDHSPGGSSGGAGALVAARVVPIAHGSDAGGSIRIPSSSCGVVGLKPSRGRGFEPFANRVLPAPILTYGVLTRTVRDTAHFLAAIEQRMPSRKLAPVGLVEGPSDATLRIGLFVDSPLGDGPSGHGVAPEIVETTRAAGRALEKLGHDVAEIPCPYEAQILEDTWRHIGFLAWGFALQTRLRGRRYDAALLEPWTHGLVAHWKSRTDGVVAIARRMRATRHVSAELYQRFDVLVCPTLAGTPPTTGTFAPDGPFEATLEREMHHFPFTPIQNATGDPAISLPLGVSSDGLPIGVQLAAAPGGEAKLLELAYALEAAGAFRTLDG